MTTNIVRDDKRGLILSGPIPTSESEQLELLRRAADIMEAGQAAGAPTFDHAKRLFDLVHAFLEVTLAQRAADAHQHLTNATKQLKRATWALVVVTVLLAVVTCVLGAIEVLKR